jgi:hypothetical protein
MTMTLISTVTVGSGGAANIDFTSIPQTYTDLVILLSTRTTNAAVNDNPVIRFNASTSSYSLRRLYTFSNGSASSDSLSYITVGNTAGNNTTSNTFGNSTVYVPNYTGSTYKSVSADGVSEYNGTAAAMAINAGLWSNTSAITQVTFVSEAGSNFMQYSTASLYGILKGSGGASVS